MAGESLFEEKTVKQRPECIEKGELLVRDHQVEGMSGKVQRWTVFGPIESSKDTSTSGARVSSGKGGGRGG